MMWIGGWCYVTCALAGGHSLAWRIPVFTALQQGYLVPIRLNSSILVKWNIRSCPTMSRAQNTTIRHRRELNEQLRGDGWAKDG